MLMSKKTFCVTSLSCVTSVGIHTWRLQEDHSVTKRLSGLTLAADATAKIAAANVAIARTILTAGFDS